MATAAKAKKRLSKGHSTRRDPVDVVGAGGVDGSKRFGSAGSIGGAGFGDAVSDAARKTPQSLQVAPGVDGLDGVGEAPADIGEAAGNNFAWRARVRRLLGSEDGARFEAGIELIADQAARLDRLARTGEERYLSDDGDAEDGRLAIAAMDAVGKRVPIFVPEKVALTDPSGQTTYSGLSDEELDQRYAELSAGRAPQLASGA